MATPQNDFERLVDVFGLEVQALETALLQILTDTILSGTAAIGQQLDGLGEVIGLERQGLTDDIYRARLRAQVRVNQSGGTIEDLIAIVDLFFDGAETFTIVESFTGFDIEITTTITQSEGEQVALVVRAGRGAGINGYVTFHVATPIFQYDGGGGAAYDGGSFYRTSLG